MRLSPRKALIAFVCLLLLAVGLGGLPEAPQAAAERRTAGGPEPGGAPAAAPAGNDAGLEAVLIKTARPYDGLVGAIHASGGMVTRQYRNFGGVAARVPASALDAIRLLAGPGAVTKDHRLALPAPVLDVKDRSRLADPGQESRIEYEAARALPAAEIAAFAAAHPDAYLVNNATTRVNTLHTAGFAGQGVVVAVLDSGIRPGFFHLGSDGSVIGCENLIDDDGACSNFANDGHGTFVAGMISANAVFGFNPASTFFRSVTAHLPAATLPPNGIAMIGSAPLSSIFAMRVCAAGGCFTSSILAAIDRAIDLRLMHEAGEAEGVDIQVLNMSLGGPTLFAGRDLFDTAVDALLQNDIVVATSAGNSGPSGLTSGSPASSLSSISVGAASIPGYERIVADLQLGFGAGILFRPTGHIQTAAFSSRGPHADGRRSPDVIASGDWSFGQGFSATTGGVNFAGGTSFSSPTVAGIAAVLRQAFPGATARQIHNALVLSANPGLLGDGSGPQDQGAGYVDAAAARSLLAAGSVPDALPEPPPFIKSVKNNLETNAGLATRSGVVQETVGPLRPGQRHEFIYEVTPNTAQVVVTLSNFSASLPPDQQNQLLGDDFYFTVHSAKTSRQPGTSGYLLQAFTRSRQLVINDPEPGLVRVTLNGDWTNAGEVTADLGILSIAVPIPQFTEQGRIAEGEVLMRTIDIPAGTAAAEFRFGWREGHGHFPSNDLDLVLVDPDGVANFAAASLDAPETALIQDPKPGKWGVVLIGFELHSPDDRYELRISLDGNVVR